jgi:hypothetical protein
MRNRHTTAALAAATLLTLTACSTEAEPDKPADKPVTESGPTPKVGGLPPKPTGQERADLLDALSKAAPDTVRYEDKAIDASRNQCSALDSDKANWLASQRFTYKDVTTTEEQGKAINDALRSLGFCDA